jgi:hypothetical protein
MDVDKSKTRIEKFATEKGVHRLDSSRAQGVYEALLEVGSIALGRRERGHRSLGDRTGLTAGQLDRALKFLSDARLVNIETSYGRVVVSVREASCGQVTELDRMITANQGRPAPVAPADPS